SAESICINLLSLVAFSLAFNYRFTAFALMFFGISILYFSLKQKIKVKTKVWLYILPWIAFYIWFAIGFFYSEDKYGSYRDLETKFSLLALPILIGIFTKASKNKLMVVFISFIAGLLCIEIISLFYAAS